MNNKWDIEITAYEDCYNNCFRRNEKVSLNIDFYDISLSSDIKISSLTVNRIDIKKSHFRARLRANYPNNYYYGDLFLFKPERKECKEHQDSLIVIFNELLDQYFQLEMKNFIKLSSKVGVSSRDHFDRAEAGSVLDE